LAIALEIGLTGDNITAARAHSLGLVNVIVPADRVLDVAVELAGRIARNGSTRPSGNEGIDAARRRQPAYGARSDIAQQCVVGSVIS
jgi:enoyl-CoA hydratase/carnithine racemase